MSDLDASPAYDPADIRHLLAGLNRGNPARDSEAVQLFRTILAEPRQGGLPPDLLAAMQAASQSTTDGPGGLDA